MLRQLALRCAVVSFLAAVSCPFFAKAQYATPVIDGSIGAAEYGNTSNGTNQIATSTTQTWYVTWDAANLYVAVTNANLAEGAVLYFDANPVTPPTGGTNANGNLSGFNYDGEQVTSLPFRAQFVAYFKDGYREYRTADGNGNWTGGTSGFGSFADSGNGNVRELAIPWSAITGGGIPASFLFLGLLTSSGGYVYGQVPNDNGGAFIGTNATYTQYFQVDSTANGASTPPFSLEASDDNFNSTGLYHNTFDPYYRSQEGAVPAGSTVTLRLRTGHLGASAVYLRTYSFDTVSGNTAGPVDSPMTLFGTRNDGGTVYDVYTIDYAAPSTPAVIYYKFHALQGSSGAFYSDDYIDDYDNLNKGGAGAATKAEPFDSFQITAYDPNFTTPAWMANANLYFLLPDRFRNGDPTNDYCQTGSTAGCPSFYGAPGSSTLSVPQSQWNSRECDPRNSSSPCFNNFGSIFYNGDLAGVQQKLDYLQSIGFDSIYMNPIFQASSYHRYDTDDFFNVDPALGGNAAFTSLITEMSHRGMQVILDGVFNHSSSDGMYFNQFNRFSDSGACQSLSSVYRNWIHFLDNNVPCTNADFIGWAGVSTLPAFDHTVPAVQNFFYGGATNSTPNVMQNWYSQGAGGWRFDVAPDPNFPFSWWVNTRTAAKSYNPNGPLVGEIWPNASQWLAGNGLDSTMNYRFRRNVSGFVRWPYGFTDTNDNGNDSIVPLTPSQFDTANRAVRDDYPPQATAVNMNLIDSHDTNRALYVFTELGDTGLTQAKQRLELAALFQFTYIGTPTVFYGDEVALNSPSLANDGSGFPIGDPYSRAPYPWTDLPGDTTIYGPPDQSVLSFYTKLGHLRKQYAELRNGTFVTLLTGDTQQASTAANTYAFARVGQGETAIVALNNGSLTNNPMIPVSAYYPDGSQLQDAISGAAYTVAGGNVTFSLNALSGAILLPYPATIDTTAPTGSIALTPAANANGWINAASAIASITAADTQSGVSQIRYWVDNGAVSSAAGTSASASVAGEGKHTVSARVLDIAGNISSLIALPVNLDVTPPVVTLTGVIAGGVYAKGSAEPVCTTTDSLSGVGTPASLSVVGKDDHDIGRFTATCSGAFDKAGNAGNTVSAEYRVVAGDLDVSAGMPSDGVNGMKSVPFVLTNGGKGVSNNATIASVTDIDVLAGSGTVTVASGVPVDLGTVAASASTNATVVFNWPTTVRRVRLTVHVTADGGYRASFKIEIGPKK